MDQFLYYWLKFVAILTQLIALFSKNNTPSSETETTTSKRDRVKNPIDGVDFIPDV